MHRAIGMRRLSRRAALLPHHRPVVLSNSDCNIFLTKSNDHQSISMEMPAAAMTASGLRRRPVVQGGPMVGGVNKTVSMRWISSSAPMLKGRRGGASAFLQRPTRSRKKPSKEKKARTLKATQGERFAQSQRLGPGSGRNAASGKTAEESEGPVDAAMMERLAKITPEKSRELQELAEDFLDTPLGDQELGSNQFLVKEDADALMHALGISTSESDPFKTWALPDSWAGDWKKRPLEKMLPEKQPPAISGDSVTPPGVLADGLEAETMEAQAQPSPASTPATIVTTEGGEDEGGIDSMYPIAPAASADATATDLDVSQNLQGGMAGLQIENQFSYLIQVLNAKGRFEEARLRILPEMKRRGVRVNSSHYTSLFSGAAMDKNPRAADELWADMLSRGIKPTEFNYESRIHAHCSAGWMHSAFKVGDEMREAGFPWTVMTYTSMIAGCNRKRYYKRAWQTYKDMVINGVQPDVMTYSAIMKMCADTHQYERAMKFCREMEEMDGIQPTLGTVEVLIRAAAKAPQWIEAYGNIVDDLVIKIKGLNLKPREQTYRALMFAYGKGGDADRVLQCIEEVHDLLGHDVNDMGDGVPRLSPQTYCAALNALASCSSAGFDGGTRPRWGALPHQRKPNLDITPVDVLKSDADRLKTLKSQAITWDEDAEMSLKKGHGRVKFRGVETPKDLQDDDEWERMVQEEHSRVMRKAKHEKIQRERQELIDIGVDPDEGDFSHERPCLFPDPAGRDNMKENMPAWMRGGPDAPGLPDAPGIPPELLFGDPEMEEEHQRLKKLEEMSGGSGEGLMLGAVTHDAGDGKGGEGWDPEMSEQSRRNEALFSGRGGAGGSGGGNHDGMSEESVTETLRKKRFGGDVPVLLAGEVDDVEEEGEGSAERSADRFAEEDGEQDEEWVERDGRLVAGGSRLRMPAYLDSVVGGMREAAAEERAARKTRHKHDRGDGDTNDDADSDSDADASDDELLEIDGGVRPAGAGGGNRLFDDTVGNRPSVATRGDGADAEHRRRSLRDLFSSSFERDGGGDIDWDPEVPEDLGQPHIYSGSSDSGSGGRLSVREEHDQDEDDQKKMLERMLGGKRQVEGARAGRPGSLGGFGAVLEGGDDDGESTEDTLVRMLNEARGEEDGEDDSVPTPERVEAMLDKLLAEAGEYHPPARFPPAADGSGDDDRDPFSSEGKVSRNSSAAREWQRPSGGLASSRGEDDYEPTTRRAERGHGEAKQQQPRWRTKPQHSAADADPEIEAQKAFEDMVQSALGRQDDGGEKEGVTSLEETHATDSVLSSGLGVQRDEGEVGSGGGRSRTLQWTRPEFGGGGVGHWSDGSPRLREVRPDDAWEVDTEEGGRDGKKKKPWVPLMHLPFKERNYELYKMIQKLEKDAMVAARNADRAAGYGDGERSGPAVEGVMRARLLCITGDRSTGRAMRFIDEDFRAERAPFTIQSAHAVVDMYCRIGGPSVYKAVEFEERCRKEFGLRPDRRLLGTILATWSKRRNRAEMTKTLDLMQELGVPCRERDLRFCRKLVDKGTFNHNWLPVDPQANVKRVLAALKRSKKPDTRATRQAVSQVMKAKFIGGINRRF